MVILIKALQVFLSLSLLIFLHELGHFAWAKLFGIKVEKFFLFFDPGGKAIAKWKWGDTEFGIGWLPFGGYCKIAGMVDESMDMKQLSEEPKEWEFRSHPAWQRMLVMAGGVLNNIIFAILSYIVILCVWGQSYIDNSTSEVYVNDTAYQMGFRNGDRILKLDDYTPENFAMLQADLARREASRATVLRGSDTVELYIDRAMMPEVLNSQLMFDLALPFVIDSVMASGPNAGSNLRHGDRLIAINGKEIEFLQDSRPILSSEKGTDVTLGIVRGADTLSIAAQVDTSGRLGLSLMAPNIKTKRYN
ncbi:MAG TPA: RIP metalloprotease RseP, partial [Rikenellaceae bacterium]|nr:RIP metalloprotease RseP [Rikenellaceae bacterium]